uniref:ORF2 n=1 Tax=Plasmopara viticola lesion associated fusarivirus 3 TaxID=2692089 RepID=A0A7G3PLC9_9VIRU|nr:ORF2 [Plasmopara viticola lesion associated fusarivirus 3]
MSAPETCFACRGMDSHGDTKSASQTPPPGSYPESTHFAAPPSVVSTSVAVKNEVKEILQEADFAGCTWKGQPAWAVSKEKWAEVEKKLISLQSSQGTTVPVSELAELQRELSSLRLMANDFKDQNERLKYAEESLSKSLARAKENEKVARDEAAVTISKLAATQIELKSTLVRVSSDKRQYEEAIRNAKKAGEAQVVENLSKDKRRLSEDITSLNNSLQQVNSDRKAVQDKLKRFELQVVELNNELLLERSKHAISTKKEGSSFADKAKAMGKEPVRLFNIASQNLSNVAKQRFQNISSNPVEDEKNTLFWLKAMLDSTKHAVFKPYKKVIIPLADEIKCFSPDSRKMFDPFLIKVRDSLLPEGQPLTESDMNNFLTDINIDQLKLNNAYKAKGFVTLADLEKHGLCLGRPDASDINYMVVKGHLIPHSSSSKVNKSLDEIDAESVSVPLEPEEKKDPSDEGEDPVSFWVKVRTWFHVQYDSLKPRVRKSLASKPSRLLTYFKLSTGTKFQRMISVPYTWYIWLFP